MVALFDEPIGSQLLVDELHIECFYTFAYGMGPSTNK